MRKCDELKDPNSCLNKARDDELLFVLLARDSEAAETVRYWALRRVAKAKNAWHDLKIQEALAWADRVESMHRQKESDRATGAG